MRLSLILNVQRNEVFPDQGGFTIDTDYHGKQITDMCEKRVFFFFVLLNAHITFIQCIFTELKSLEKERVFIKDKSEISP